MAKYSIEDSTLQGIADAIRAKAGTSDPIATSAFAEAIAAIEAGGGGFPNGKKWEKIFQVSSSSDDINDMVYANGLYMLALSYGGRIKYSTDGVNFTNTNVTGIIKKIVYADGLWVAMGVSGLWYSTDGMNWTQSDTIQGCHKNYTNVPLYHHENGIWLAGNDTATYYSTDAVTWTECVGARKRIQDFASIKGVLVGIFGGDIYYSTDCINWAKSNANKGSYYNGLLCSANGLMLAFSNTLKYSTDGINWTEPEQTLSDVVRLYHAANLWQCTSSSGIYYSADGINWAQSNITDSVKGIEYACGIWVAAGLSGIYYSLDGITWAEGETQKSTSSTKQVKHVNNAWYVVVDLQMNRSVTWEP